MSNDNVISITLSLKLVKKKKRKSKRIRIFFFVGGGCFWKRGKLAKNNISDTIFLKETNDIYIYKMKREYFLRFIFRNLKKISLCVCVCLCAHARVCVCACVCVTLFFIVFIYFLHIDSLVEFCILVE